MSVHGLGALPCWAAPLFVVVIGVFSDFLQNRIMLQFTWSNSEKKVAQKAFDKALNKELASVLGKLKTMASDAKEPEGIWAVHDYLGWKRREIDEKYDYRYSQLIFVFSRLLSEGWLQAQDLQGLGEEKIQAIEYMVSSHAS